MKLPRKKLMSLDAVAAVFPQGKLNYIQTSAVEST
jgi:hypothetical protein